MTGYLSLLLRKRRARKEKHEITEKYKTWKQEIDTLSPARLIDRKVLVIRLDDIGDYILFRNCLEVYQRFFAGQGYKVHLLGNDTWKPVFEQYDGQGIQPLWLNKKRYWQDAAYRLLTWEKLRMEGFEIVICPSRTRPLLLDDLCMLAAAPSKSFAAANTHVHATWNDISDKLYTDVNELSCLPGHEFTFNTNFAVHICPSAQLASIKLHLAPVNVPTEQQPYLICFVGASAKSKLWPVERWIKLIQLAQGYFNGTIFIAGGLAEKNLADEIAKATKSSNIAGTKTLTEMIDLIAYSQITISNDTMAAHIGAASGTGTIIITTGNNGHRFTDYSKTGKDNIITIYSPRYKKLLKKGNQASIYTFQGITSDIAAIDEQTVFSALQQYLTQVK